MNILLINPVVPNKFKIFDYCDEKGKRAIKKRVLIGPPLALNELAGIIPEENVYIVDMQEESNLNPNYDFEEELKILINEFRPDIVGITCLTAQFNNVTKMINIIKEVSEDIFCIIGGVHASSAPRDFLITKADVLCIGLGKHSFYHLVSKFKDKGFYADFLSVPGIALIKDGDLVYSKSLCEISYKDFMDEYFLGNILPNRTLTDRYQYLIPDVNKRIHYLCTSMGCPSKCNFCYLWKMTNGKFFHKSIDDIIAELKTMNNYFVIRFADANTFGDLKKARELFQRIIDEGLNKNHIFMGDVRCDTVINNRDLIELAVKAGLRLVVCGLEATSDEELKNYGKGSGVQEIIDGLHILNEMGIKVNGNYIVRPDYDIKDFDRLKKFIMNNPIHNTALTILTPFPGTEQWDELYDQIVIKDYDYFNLTNCVLKSKLPEDEFYNQIANVYEYIEETGKVYEERYGKFE